MRSLLFTLLKTALISITVALVALATLGVVWLAIKPRSLSPSQVAIALAKSRVQSGADTMVDIFMRAVGVSSAERPDEFVQGQIKNLHGDVTVKGWTANEVGPDKFVVSFAWTNEAKNWVMPFEVDTAQRFVRPILTDDTLAKKYGFRTEAEYAEMEASTKQKLQEKFPKIGFSYADHVLNVTAVSDGRYSADDIAAEFYKEAKPVMRGRKDEYLKVVVAKGTVVAGFDGASD